MRGTPSSDGRTTTKKRRGRIGVTKATVRGYNNKRHINGDATAGCD